MKLQEGSLHCLNENSVGEMEVELWEKLKITSMESHVNSSSEGNFRIKPDVTPTRNDSLNLPRKEPGGAGNPGKQHETVRRVGFTWRRFLSNLSRFFVEFDYIILRLPLINK